MRFASGLAVLPNLIVPGVSLLLTQGLACDVQLDVRGGSLVLMGACDVLGSEHAHQSRQQLSNDLCHLNYATASLGANLIGGVLSALMGVLASRDVTWMDEGLRRAALLQFA